MKNLSGEIWQLKCIIKPNSDWNVIGGKALNEHLSTRSNEDRIIYKIYQNNLKNRMIDIWERKQKNKSLKISCFF